MCVYDIPNPTYKLIAGWLFLSHPSSRILVEDAIFCRSGYALDSITDKQIKPDHMHMGETGMGKMIEISAHMPKPKNLPPIGSPDAFSLIDMSGIFTILKVRENLTNYSDSEWYQHPKGSVAYPETP